MSEDNQLTTPKWLQELQQRSWEPEILLSGIVLYGMFKVPDLLDDFLIYFKLNIFGNSNDFENLIALFKMGTYWLIAGLILHLICRGIWIGMVGLSYTFPNGIRKDRLEYKGKFKEKVENTPSFEKIVIRLEKISSSLFSISFMLFMCIIGGYFYFLVLLVLPFTIGFVIFDIDFSGVFLAVFTGYVMIVVIIGLLALLDFLSLGYFRRFKLFAKVYWPIHKVVSVLTLSRFYRPIYYGVVSNFNKWLFFLFLSVFSIVSIFGANAISDTIYPGDSSSRLSVWGTARGYSAFNGYYDDQNVDKFSIRASIPSDVIGSNVIKLFVPANIAIEEDMLALTDLDSLREAYPDTASSALKLMVVQEYYRIELDGEPLTIDRWYFHYKSHTAQRGFLTYINISEVEEGMHYLSIEGRPDTKYADIPFYRDITFRETVSPSREEGAEKKTEFQPKPFGIRD